MEYIILATFVIVLINGVLLFFYLSSARQPEMVRPSLGVLSRKELRKQLDDYIYEHRRYQSQFCVLMVLIKGASNELVAKLARYARGRIRLIDQVAEGEEELVFIMPHTYLKGASLVGMRVRMELSEELQKIEGGVVTRKLPVRILNFPRDEVEIKKLAKGKPLINSD